MESSIRSPAVGPVPAAVQARRSCLLARSLAIVGTVGAAIPGAVAGEGLPALPTSDRMLRCVVNLNGYAEHYPLDRWADTPLVTDFTVHKGSVPDEAALHQRVIADATGYNDRILIGRYLSGGRVETAFDRYPKEAVHAEHFPPPWLRRGTNRVDLENANAAGRFAKRILAEFDRNPRPVLFLDNIVHPSSLRGWFPWETTCRFLGMLRRGLQERQARLVVNIAVASWAMSDEDVDRLAEVVDGMSFEMPTVFSRLPRTTAVRKLVVASSRNGGHSGSILTLLQVIRGFTGVR